MTHNLTWKKFHPLTDKNAFICLADEMGTDSTIVERARTSYGKDGKSVHQLRLKLLSERLGIDLIKYDVLNPGDENVVITLSDGKRKLYKETEKDRFFWKEIAPKLQKAQLDDRNLIRLLMRQGHTSPFEMVELVFLVQVPMDCWRQWIRHRTASVNEYSTRYTEALDFFQVTAPTEWRLQATDNKQGSSGYLDTYESDSLIGSGGNALTIYEKEFHNRAKEVYQQRLESGVAKEQARKDLPLSTYTRAYWKCDLHNIFNFLRLRMDSHAQLEIRQFANSMFEIVKVICPVACEAFEDYVLNAKKFSRMEMEVLKTLLNTTINNEICTIDSNGEPLYAEGKPLSMTDREWKEFLGKLS